MVSAISTFHVRNLKCLHDSAGIYHWFLVYQENGEFYDVTNCVFTQSEISEQLRVINEGLNLSQVKFEPVSSTLAIEMGWMNMRNWEELPRKSSTSAVNVDNKQTQTQHLRGLIRIEITEAGICRILIG